MNSLFTWFDERTGFLTACRLRRERTVPASGRCTNAWGAALVFAFFFQAITGIALWLFYSPSAQTAWESVYFLQYHVPGGWLLRAAHLAAGNVLVGMCGLYLLWLIVSGRYRVPREFVFWVALVMGLFVLALTLTGDLLPWDENRYFGTKARVSYLLVLPVVGDILYKLALGGPDVGQYTLTRFFALHAGVFSVIFGALTCLHVWMLRRADALESPEAKKTVTHWPRQSSLNALACLLVLVAIGAVIVANGKLPTAPPAPGTPVTELGMELGAPADPADPFDAARPEWAFVGIYKLVKMWPDVPQVGEYQVIPVFVIPGLLVGYFLLMPIIGRLKIGHFLNVVVSLALVGGTAWLSYASFLHDRNDPKHQEALAVAHAKAERAKILAQSPTGIPPLGAVSLLRSDPKTQGPKLFTTHCAGCHNYLDAQGKGIASSTPSAPNLYGFPGRTWIAGVLDLERIKSDAYFGKTAFKNGDMVGFVKETLVDLGDDEKAEVESLVMALSAEAGLKSQKAADAADANRITEGREFITDIYGCADCHKFHDKGQLGTAPNLTGYGSRAWLIGIIANPAHKEFYGENNDRMPAYCENPGVPGNILKISEVEILADWLRGEWYEPGQAAEAPGEAAAEETEAEEPEAEEKPAPAEADAAPAETAPAETTPAETTPAEEAPAEEAPAETAPAEETPSEMAPVETAPPAEPAAADAAPVESAPAETAP